jgi:hypothetical protein
MHTSSRSDAPSLRSRAWRWPALLTALAAFALVIGCAQTPPPGEPEPTVLRGSAAWGDLEGAEPGPLLAVSLWMLDIEIPGPGEPDVKSASSGHDSQSLRSAASGLDVDGDALRASTVVEFDDGFYLAGLGQVAADGTYELVLPDGDAIPEALFRDAEDAVAALFFADGPACTVEASDPTARVTLTLFEGLTIASPAFLTPMGLGAGLTTTEAVAPDHDFEAGLPSTTFVSLAYATAPTNLATTGADCAPEAGFTVDVDVELVEGWNQLTWVFVPDEGITVRDRAMDEPVFSLVFPYVDL